MPTFRPGSQGPAKGSGDPEAGGDPETRALGGFGRQAGLILDPGPAGKILVTDVHEDNVIVASSGIAYPIDVHFSFRSREERLAALPALGIW